MKTQFTLATLSAGLIVAFSAPSFAQSGECSTDADCPDNYRCETFQWEACPDCAPGETCAPCESGTDSACVPPPPKECDSANPCEGDDVCVTYTFETCSGTVEPTQPCDPDGTCPDPAPEPTDPPTCETSSESYCVPPYLAPCEADADCGEGFTCEALESCACSGGGSTGEPGTDPMPVDPDCGCEPSGENYCQLIEVECTSDADCAAGLTCQDLYGGDVAVASCVEGEPCPAPEPIDPVSYCAPPSYGYYGGGGVDGGGYGESVAVATGRDDANVTKSEREEFFPVDGTDGTGSKQSPSSCSTAGSGSGGSLLLLLAGLVFGRRRRRS